ncbi:MAG: putative motility protein [Devosia sp.]|uniref:putative motility protein n=1 Tax=Devosia sp. TaxID=1871048 RepID=UPI0024C9AB0E|nr:putative motility protein [Devosia sp.]UYN98452.1 MAG: putative motility protein [Devosia sp.]
MDTDLSMNLIAARTAMTQNSVQIAVFKKAHEMQTELINSLMQTALSAPPPGQGLRVDKQA